MWERNSLGLIGGPLVFLIMRAFPPPQDMSALAWAVAAVAVLMAIWWVSEALPIAATALLPVVLFPALGVMGGAAVTASYAHYLIFLFLGGFLIAVTLQRWGLHRRLALHTIVWVGLSPRRMVLGFMTASAVLSMWISNTATVMMMLPIAVAVTAQLGRWRTGDLASGSEGEQNFAIALMLGVAYAASIGGVATLIGTPPNAILAGMADELYGLRISFADWFVFALPLALLMLGLCWFYLTRMAYPIPAQADPQAAQLIEEELQALGPMSREERRVLAVFTLVALAWMGRGFFKLEALALINDATIAMCGALLLFVIPSDFRRREFLLDWPTARSIPWEILLLFGGGFALANGINDSGLSAWIVERLQALQGAPLLALVAAVALLVIFLTEITSNTATATLTIPLLGALAVAMEIPPFLLMFPAAIAASYAFMLPVATPPNAIVFSSGLLSMAQMVRAGFWLNLLASVLITAWCYWLLPRVWAL